jgi:hypothetical protein
MGFFIFFYNLSDDLFRSFFYLFMLRWHTKWYWLIVIFLIIFLDLIDIHMHLARALI